MLRRFWTKSWVSSQWFSLAHTHSTPTKRGSVYFLPSCSRGYSHKQVPFFFYAGLFFLVATFNKRKILPLEGGKNWTLLSQTDVSVLLLKMFLTTNSDKHGGKCHANCSLAVFLTTIKQNFSSLDHMLGSLVNTVCIHPPSKSSWLHLFLFFVCIQTRPSLPVYFWLWSYRFF